MIIALIKFKKTPVLAICATVILFELNTIALGGVATGNIKAIKAERVAGSINNNGLIFT